jgi:hypothetical protein
VVVSRVTLDRALRSAHDEAGLAALKAAAAERLAAGQAELDLGVAGPGRVGAVADHLFEGRAAVETGGSSSR